MNAKVEYYGGIATMCRCKDCGAKNRFEDRIDHKAGCGYKS